FRPAAWPRCRRSSNQELETSFRGARSAYPESGFRVHAKARVPDEDFIHPLHLCWLSGLGLDLADGIDHGVEGQHGRGMARLVIAYRLEQRDIGPFALRGP